MVLSYPRLPLESLAGKEPVTGRFTRFVAIDSAGQLPSGEAFIGAKELATQIAAKPEFARCVAKKLFTYALGRPPVDAAGQMDMESLDGMAEALVTGNYSWNELVARIVTSAPFTQRRGEPASGGMP